MSAPLRSAVFFSLRLPTVLRVDPSSRYRREVGSVNDRLSPQRAAPPLYVATLRSNGSRRSAPRLFPRITDWLRKAFFANEWLQS